MFKLIYVLFGEQPKEVIASYDEIITMISDISHGRVLSVREV